MFKILRTLPVSHRWPAISLYFYLMWNSTTTKWIPFKAIAQAIRLCRSKAEYGDTNLETAVAGALAAYEAELAPAQQHSYLSPYAGPSREEVKRFRDNALADAARWYIRQSRTTLREGWELIQVRLDKWFPLPPEKGGV